MLVLLIQQEFIIIYKINVQFNINQCKFLFKIFVAKPWMKYINYNNDACIF